MNANSIKLGSLNVRGLRINLKRKKLFRYIKERKLDVTYLQETHGDAKSNYLWESEFGKKCIFSNGETNSRGVMTILDKKLSQNLLEIRRDVLGRYLLCKCKINEYTYCFANIYAPNGDDPEFFREVIEQIENLDCIYVIVGGDFNLVMNNCIDRNRDNNSNQKPHAKEVLCQYMQDSNMSDVWRKLHPDKKSFTWVKTVPKLCWSRIDWFLTSDALLHKQTTCEIIPCTLTDHSLVELEIETDCAKRGPGIWKAICQG